jgi:putative transcriptional regulator
MSANAIIPEELLLDYAAGAASPCLGLLVATHLALSPDSRELHAMLEAVGGALLDSLKGENVTQVSAASVLAQADRLDSGPDQMPPAGLPATVAPAAGDDAGAALAELFGPAGPPRPLCPYAREVADRRAWRRLGPRAAAARLSVSSAQEHAYLLWARAGTRIARHEHRGREAALVLRGAFWDGGTCYGAGAVAAYAPGTAHAPEIDPAEDCLCLAVIDPGAIHFTGRLGWLLNRLIRL